MQLAISWKMSSMMLHYVLRRSSLCIRTPDISFSFSIEPLFWFSPQFKFRFFTKCKYPFCSFFKTRNYLRRTSEGGLTNFFVTQELQVCCWALPCLAYYSVKWGRTPDTTIIPNTIVSRPPVIHFAEKYRDLELYFLCVFIVCLYSQQKLRTSLELFKIRSVGDGENSIHQRFRKYQWPRVQTKKST